MFRLCRMILLAGQILIVSNLFAAVPLPSVASRPRELDFGGMTWRIKFSASAVAPGPNPYSASVESVWVDQWGLHLTIRKIADVWHATEVFTKERVGYGTYTFSVESDVNSYDEAVVAGFFTWDTAPQEFHREIDIEFAAWGQPGGPKFQYVVQPYDDPDRIEVFDPRLQGNSTTHRIIWNPQKLEFLSYHGLVDPDDPAAQDNLMHRWVFGGKPPTEGRVRFRMNLWLFQGKAPKDAVSLVVTSFSFLPLEK